MELSAELFDQVVRALGPGAAPATEPLADRGDQGGVNQRRSGRIAISAEVMLCPHGVAGAQPRQVMLRSLSRGGAAVLDPLVRQPGEHVVLHLPAADGRSIPIVCMVMNARLCGDGQFRIGLQFRCRAEHAGPAMVRGALGVIARGPAGAPEEVLDAIARGERPAARHNRRAGDTEYREQRFELDLQAMASRYEQGRTGAIHVVTVKDISLGGGVCVLHPVPLKKDEQFVLQIPRHQGPPITLLCTTVESRPINDHVYRVGARFEKGLLGQAEGAGLFGRLLRWFAA